MVTGLNEKLFDYDDLQAHWGCSLSTARRRVAEGRIPAVRLGPRLVRFRPADIEKYEEDCLMVMD